MKEITDLQKMIDEVDNIVFFGGAGVSTESGIKDFRSSDGLYNMKNNYQYPAHELLSSRIFYSEPELFFQFYKENLNALKYKPNVMHLYLKKLEERGKLKAIVTQNIDGLHTLAGSKKVLEIHGTIYQNHCLKCKKVYGPETVFKAKGIPKCECGGVIKPNVVLYGESLPLDVYQEAISKISESEMLIVAGTSLTVEPAASMINYFQGKYLVIINKDKTPYDSKADLVINKPLKDVFGKLDC